MANGYGGSSSSSSSSYSSSSSITQTDRAPAPPGFHYMPDGTLMSDVEHEKLYNKSAQDEKTKVIKNFNIDLSNIKAAGESRRFIVQGDSNSVFTLIVKNNHDNYYNFTTETFTTTPNSLQEIIKSRAYNGSIKFPALPDTNTDTYDFYLIASLQENTKHSQYKEARYADNTVDFNSSSGSDSAVLLKKIYQEADKTVTLTAISPNALTGFSGVSITTDAVTVSGRNRGEKLSFTIVATANTNRNFVIQRQPLAEDFAAYVERTIGSASLPISGEDVSSSTYYRWPINNIVGLLPGMFLAPSSDVTAGTVISDYKVTVEETVVKKQKTSLGSFISKSYTKDSTIDFVKAIEPTAPAVLTNGVVTSQAGNVVFNLQQADALKDNDIKIYGYGSSSIKSLSGYDLKFSNLKVELTPVTTTVDGVVSNSTNVTIDERAGIRDKVSTVTGVGIDVSAAIPTVDSGAGAVNSNGTIVLSAAQTLEDGITLTFGGASRIATITGEVEVLEAGASDVVIRLDLEKILTAT